MKTPIPHPQIPLFLLILLAHSFAPLPAIRAQELSEVAITSVQRTTNGVKIAWSDPATNQAYTVQVRESLTKGSWRNATTRYRWPWPHKHWGDIPVNLPSSRYYRVVSQTIAPAQRGKLINNSARPTITLNSLNQLVRELHIDGFIHPKFGVSNRAFTYETIDPYGIPINASALLILPQGASNALPLISVQHGTLFLKMAAPSQSQDTDDYIWGAALASHGYAVIMPDYIGLGTSPGYQAFVHARSEATTVIDAIRAGKSLCATNKISLNGQLFLTGYSQGGHATLAAQREIESAHSDELPITASAPAAGVHDLGGTSFEYILAHSGDYPTSAFFALLIGAYLPLYDLADTLEELLDEPYRRTLPSLVNGETHPSLWVPLTPQDPYALFRPAFQQDFRTNVQNPFRQALLDNNTYGWTPKSPTKILHCQGDLLIPSANAEIAYQDFISRGACCVTLSDPGSPEKLDHPDCFLPSLREIITWFDSLRK